MNANSRAICPYCGVGCHVDLKVTNNHIAEVTGTKESPVNRGKVCPKGALLAPVLELSGRLLSPQVRYDRTGDLVNVGWNETLTHVSQKLQGILEKYGPDSVALFGSGQLDTEAW